MPIHSRRPLVLLQQDARHTLGMSQREFGYAVGSSHRSAVRWASRAAEPAPHHLRRMAELVYPANRALAAEIADVIDESLETLGLEKPAPPAALPGPILRDQDLVDLVVLAAVESSGSPPAVVRQLLHAAFKRGRELGLAMEVAEKVLAPPAATAKRAPAAR